MPVQISPVLQKLVRSGDIRWCLAEKKGNRSKEGVFVCRPEFVSFWAPCMSTVFFCFMTTTKNFCETQSSKITDSLKRPRMFS